MEDDIQFHVDEVDLKKVVDEFVRNRKVDVLVIGGWTVGPTAPISDCLAITASTLQTTCYIAKKSAVPHLVQSHRLSAERLISGLHAREAAIDVQWLNLQRKSLVFAVPRTALASQFSSHSDLTGKTSPAGIPQRPKRPAVY